MNEKQFDFNHWENGLDDLFREAADALQPAPPAYAWLDMSRLLDEDERKRRRSFGWWWLPLLLFLAGHEHLVSGSGTIKEHTMSDGLLAYPKTKHEQQSMPLTSLPASKSTDNPSGSTTATDQTDLVTESIRLEVLRSKSSKKQTALIPAASTSSKSISRNLPVTVENERFKEAVTHSVLLKDQALYPALPQKLKPDWPRPSVSPAGQPFPSNIPQSIQRSDSNPPSTDTPDVQKPSRFRFYVYGGAGAERGFVKNNTASMRPAYGGGIGAYLNTKWSIQAGLWQTRKVYNATGNDYTPKKGSYYDNPNYVIKEVEADCAILEIPVTLRYNFYQRKKHGFYGMLSVQNSIMQRESYEYYYSRFGQPANGYYTYRTRKLELLSGIGLSIGYEHSIGSRLHWQLAPYFSIPTSGVGEGSVKLSSAGIYTGVRYSFWKKK